MLLEIRNKSQITIPNSIIKSLNLKVGDQLEIIEKDGVIYLLPVSTYPKAYIEKLNKDIKELKQNLKEGKQETFNSIDKLLEMLEK